MKASLLTVGTEITSGQITNGNARVISANLMKSGIETVLQISVPDDRQRILEALTLCENQTELIFVTGGLGPTSDDFTRELIQKWAELPLEFDEVSWVKVQARLIERDQIPHDFQKQQCYFPKGSTVLDNSQGTANGFYLKKGRAHLWALPGPPNEIEALWSEHIKKQIQNFNLDPIQVKSWDVVGIGENQLAHIVEPAIQKFSGLVGYRVHQPFVEFKLIVKKSEMIQSQIIFSEVEAILKPYTVARDGESFSRKFANLMMQAPHVLIIDEVTSGQWLGQLSPYTQNQLAKSNFTYTNQVLNIPDAWTVHLKKDQQQQVQVIIDQQKPVGLQSPFQSSALIDRSRLYFAEMAMFEAVKIWESKNPSP
jgi:nicotinamide-nucleotide amidase